MTHQGSEHYEGRTEDRKKIVVDLVQVDDTTKKITITVNGKVPYTCFLKADTGGGCNSTFETEVTKDGCL